MTAPLLLPMPRRCVATGGLVVVPERIAIVARDAERLAEAKDLLGEWRPCVAAEDGLGWLDVEWDGCTSAHPEAYALVISDALPAVRIAARTTAALRHALHTLAQLLKTQDDALPALRIEDEPAFAVRGVMLDVSRDRVPTMDELTHLVDRLASWKINHLQLYTEHTFAYAGHEAVWRNASPLTPAEVRRLDRHCRSRGITLAANQNCLGHLEHWFAEPRYAELAEIAPGQDWDFGGIITKTGPFSLCPTDPRSLELVQDLLDQLLPCFSSPWVNIGCDEAYDVGQGRSRSAVAERGRAAVYLDHVRAVCALAARHGKRPQFWADIALEHPEALADLPAELVGLAWGYEADAPFARWCDQLRAAGREVWVCPGTSCWRSITGRTTERRANLLAAARDGLAHGATGYLVTAWGDLGHRQQWPITQHALAEGAHRAWSGTAPFDARASSLHAFDDGTLALGPWLDALGDVDLELRRMAGKPQADGRPGPLRNASALFTDLHKNLTESWVGDAAAWRAVNERLLALADPAQGGAVLWNLPAQLRAELVATLRVAVFAATRARARRETGNDTWRRDRDRWKNELERLIAEHRRLWLLRCRPGGLDDSCRHYARLDCGS